MKLICSIIIAALVVANLFGNIWHDIEGKPAKPPLGFAGVIGSLVAFAVSITLFYCAGAFDALLGK